MGYTTSTVHGIQVPDSSQANNIPNDLGLVVTALEGGSIIRRLTGAQISALTAPQKPAGLVVYNTTTNQLQVSNGSTFADVGAPTYAIGLRTSSSQTVSASSTVTVSYGSETDPSSILGSGVVTIPVAGLWMVTGSVYVTSASTTIFRCAVMVGGVGGDTDLPQQRITTELPGGESTYRGYANISGVFSASANDTYELTVTNESSSVSQSITKARFAVVKIGA